MRAAYILQPEMHLWNDSGGLVTALEQYVRMAACGRLPEITNGCFVEAKHENFVAECRTTSEKLDRRVWVGTRITSLRVHRRKAAIGVLLP